MPDRRSDRSFVEELPRLLAERHLTVRELARQVGVTDGHLSRVLRGADYKTASPGLTRRVAAALGLAPDYFPEAREGYVIERIRHDPRLRDELFDELTAEERSDV